MIVDTRPSPHRWRGWLPVLIPAAVLIVTLCVIVALRAESSSDFRDYWQTAKHFRATGEIVTDKGVHNYLPFFTIFMTPWSLLPLQVAIVLFTLLSVGLFGVTVVLAEILLHERIDARPRAALWIALGLMLPYVISSSVLGAVGLLLAFLIVTTWFLFERGREWEAGAVLGLAALIKIVPALLILFFLLKRRWRVAVAATVVFALFGGGMPLALLGPKRAYTLHEEFYKGAVVEHSAWNTLTAEKPPKVYHKNNALPTVLRRLLTETDANPGEDKTPVFVNVANLPGKTAFGVYVAIAGLLLVGSVLSALRRPIRQVESVAELETLRAQFGVWCCLMLLVSPLVWVHYLPMLYWPVAFLCDHADRARRARRFDWWAASALVIWLLGAAALATIQTRAIGGQIWPVLVLWVVLVRLVFRESRRRRPVNPPTQTPPHLHS